jgi:hypothetical protein
MKINRTTLMYALLAVLVILAFNAVPMEGFSMADEASPMTGCSDQTRAESGKCADVGVLLPPQTSYFK